ncbi:acyl-CoA thioesterase [Mangrovimicrobium sediminis]|uniref:Acyl-CoA thioesterase n=1 Tax=Mangrovimicrobium sediminis TaxID=2562682 RepID=A0A4Z0M4L0_9GAMM|nr:thioesterase family protein [Haliea sp. SAOS-164]TGD74308.1 acyl-CoA thioesterase [Haliea sp. SAOS-164]
MTENSLPDPGLRENYRWYLALNTRWMDNDVYGHINNVTYYSYFDTVANTFLIRECGLDIHGGGSVGYVVHSECHYKSALAFPQHLEGGLRVNRIGTSSVQYGIAIFHAGSQQASAHGTFTHVFVDRDNERPTPIEGRLREGLERLRVGD